MTHLMLTTHVYCRSCSALRRICLPLKKPTHTLTPSPTGPQRSTLLPQRRWTAPSSKQLPCLPRRQSLHQGMSNCSHWRAGLLPWRRLSPLSCSGHRLPKHQGALTTTTQVGLAVISFSMSCTCESCPASALEATWHDRYSVPCAELVNHLSSTDGVQGWAKISCMKMLKMHTGMWCEQVAQSRVQRKKSGSPASQTL